MFAVVLSPSPPATLLLALPKSTAICILFAASYVCPHFPLKSRSRLPSQRRLAQLFDCHHSNAHLFQPRTWPQDFQCFSRNRSRIRPGHYIFGRCPRHFQVLQRAETAILLFIRIVIFFPPLNQMGCGVTVQWVQCTGISSRELTLLVNIHAKTRRKI